MKISEEIKQKLSTVNIDNLVLFLQTQKWIKDYEDKSISIWHRTETEYLDFEILLPLDLYLKDYYERLYDALSILANFYNKDFNNIINSIVNFISDKIKIQVIEEDVKEGVIPLLDGVKLFENVKEIMIAATLATLNKKKYFFGNRPDEATRYVNSLKLGQTEKGSYIVNILSPIDLNNNDFLFYHESLSFTRKVTESLTLSLSSLQTGLAEYTKNNSFTVFDETVKNGVSANLCDAISELSGPDKKREINIVIEFANTLAEKPRRESFQFSKNDSRIMKEVANYLMENVTFEDYTLVGFVIKLARDESHIEGEIVLSCFVEEKSRNVKVYLNKEEYEIAISAHKNHKMLRINGTVVIEKRKARLVNVKKIEELDIESDYNFI